MAEERKKERIIIIIIHVIRNGSNTINLQTSQSLAVKFLAMEIKKGGFRKKC